MAEIPWIEEEDQLLKEKLQGLTVTDARSPGGRGVRVWFRWPEMEQRDIQRDPAAALEAQYPFITIDLIGVGEALDRAERGGQVRPTVQGYRPPDYAGPVEGRVHVSDWPVAMNLTYQITTWTRSIQHDRQLLRHMWVRFPGRYGSLGGRETPYVRPFSAQLLAYTPGHRIDEFGKRQFRGIYTLQVFSELWASEVCALHELTDLQIDLPIDVPASQWYNDLSCHEEC